MKIYNELQLILVNMNFDEYQKLGRPMAIGVVLMKNGKKLLH